MKKAVAKNLARCFCSPIETGTMMALLLCSGWLGSMALAAGQLVENTNATGPGSLAQAVVDVGDGETVTFTSGSNGIISLGVNSLDIQKSMDFVRNPGGNTEVNFTTGCVSISNGHTLSFDPNLKFHTETATTYDLYGFAIAGTTTITDLQSEIYVKTNASGSDVGSATGIYSSLNINVGTIGGNITALVSSGSDQLRFAYGIKANNDITINEISDTSTIWASSVADNAYGISSFGDTHIGEVAGTITATSSDESAYGISTYGAVNGGDAGTPLLLTGTIEAHGKYVSTGISCRQINLKVASTGTISATLASGLNVAICSAGTFDDSVELVAECTIAGDIDLGNGTDTITLSGTTGSTTLADDIVNVETINVTGGTWRLNGDVSGTINLTGGTLDGTGNFTSLTNSSTFAPGNSIGTTNLSGNFTQTSTGTLEIEINDSGGTDLLDVTGDVTLDGAVDVQAEAGTYTAGMTYDFVTYGGSRTGTFDSVTDNLAFLTAQLVYGPDYVRIMLTDNHSSYASIAQTFNQRAVGTYLDAHHSGATGDLSVVYTELDSLSAPAARAAFEAMSGEIYGGLGTVGIENHESFLGEIASRLRSRNLNRGRFGLAYSSGTSNRKLNDLQAVVRGQEACDDCGCNEVACTDHQAWFSGYGIGANLGGNGNASGLNYSTGGTAFGLERNINACTLLGLAAGYSQTGVHVDDRFDRSTINGAQLALYFCRDSGCDYTTGIATYGYNDYDSSRQVTVGTIARRTTAKYGGNAFSFYLEKGRSFRFRRVTFQPFAALQYIQLHQNGFTESGANSLNLTVGGIGTDSFRSLLGTRLVTDFQTRRGRLFSLEGHALWRHEFLDELRILDAGFAGQSGGPFVVRGINVDRDAAILGTGLTLYLNRHAKLYTNYDILTSTNYTAHAGTAGLMLAW